MYTSRISKRTGYGINRGATNPKVTVNETAPTNPKHKDIWLDISTSPAVQKWWNAKATPAAWTT